ncbi:cation-translocating P-type ATPase [Massilia sp. TS11]|uniref:cation-translocating P-type ATPase n=1 Tax=Massilia sp. TS11 TaxID=2908003 RepID=UPI001EDA49FD|nr:cation-translocating P-type ATPase [Massilia sp. TS11]MCG2583981.1 cation-translocating P-type ATPase [Massilia sp. TS11]
MRDTSSQYGLSSDAAAARLASDGPNALPTQRRRAWDLVREAVQEPMFLMLIVAAGLYLALGDVHEGLVLLLMVGVTIGLTLFQQGKTERALDSLRELGSPLAAVWRDGEVRQVSSRDIVVGDVLVLSEGARVAADALLLEAVDLELDESLLTGEARPVAKLADPEGPPPVPGEAVHAVWSGTLVVHGSGLARVFATGPRSEIGKIGAALHGLETAASPLQQQLGGLIRRMAFLGLGMALLVALLHGFLQGKWMEALLVGIALGMSLLPEEFPVILTVFPAIGAWRLAQAQVITRRLAAIETLGAVTVLCSDKTGTLTENRMAVVAVHTPQAAWEGGEMPAPCADLVRLAALASKPLPFDPMEKAFHALAGELSLAGELVHEFSLSAELPAMSQLWRQDDGRLLVACKGAPEAVARLCGRDPAPLRPEVERLGARGWRVLAVARGWHTGPLPDGQDGLTLEWLGLVALADPLRPEVPQAVAACHTAGVRVLMITGDHPATARAIAQAAGLASDSVLLGAEMATLDEASLRARLQSTGICARITPAQKLRIVQALQANGEVVAMTGDGVNDAPALKAAHVGIAMGRRGTEVAREAAALVLLDDHFATIVRAMALGRRIFSNMQNAMSYVVSMHVPIAGLALLPTLLGTPVLLYPMHIAFLELVIDPASSLAYESETAEQGAMLRPPRPARASLFDRGRLLRAVAGGLVAMTVAGLAYVWCMRHFPEAEARALSFVALVAANLGLIWANLGRRSLWATARENRMALSLAGITLAMLAAVTYIAPLTRAFEFERPPLAALVLAFGFGFLTYFGARLLRAGRA